MTVRTRFSPSPTGMIHLGNARAALFSALYAKKNHGIFVLRIEDTDMTRSEERFVEALQDDLHWLQIKWQEGPSVGGEYGPYWQSQREAIYQQYYEILEKKKLIYPCFCSDQELALARKIQMSRGQAPRYAGTCAKLSSEEIAARLAAGKKCAWRFAVPKNTKVEFVDTVKGPQSFNTDDIGDFIVRRADGTGPFLYSNAIDDATMNITHVIRGEDHLTNTPRQILLLKTLELPIPQYGHLSLIVGDDGSPLSKRHGSYSLCDMSAQGYLPLAITNYLSRLGHTVDAQTLLQFDELANHFNLEKLSRSPARFDKSQLMYWQKMAVQALDVDELWKWLGDKIRQQVPVNQQLLFAKTLQANIEFPRDSIEWIKVFFEDQLTIGDEEKKTLRDAGSQFFHIANEAVVTHGTNIQTVLSDIKTKLNVNGKKLFMPLRVALTGKNHGPELAPIADLLGAEKIKKRLHEAAIIAQG